MNSIKNVLAPIDFSENSFKALEYAIEIAKKTNATVHIIHAYRLIKPENPEYHSEGAALKKELETSLKLKFRDVEFQYLVSHPIEYQMILEVGFAVDVIQNMIMDKKIDMVVMGARGKRTHEEIFGSTTWSVIKGTNCPVLAVPREANLKSIKNIILANENQNFDDPGSFNLVKEIAHSFHTNLVILRCQSDNEIAGQKEASEDLNKDLFEGLKVNSLFCSDKKFVNEIKKQLDQGESDLLVFMPRENVFLESYFRRGYLKDIVIDTKIPLLMIHKPLVKGM